MAHLLSSVSNLENQFLELSCIPTELPYLKPRDTNEAASACWKEVEHSIELLSSCPFTRSFWQQVHKEGKFSIQCVPPEMLKWPAMVNIWNRTISLSASPDNLPPIPMTEGLLFELSNLKHAELFIEQSRLGCRTTAEAYAEATEKTEWLTRNITDDLFQRCLETQFWTQEEFPNFSVKVDFDFEKALAVAIQSGHYFGPILTWYRHCQPEKLPLIKADILARKDVVRLPPNFYEEVHISSLFQELLEQFQGWVSHFIRSIPS